jgi:site-specific recombinase XerD
MAAPRFFLREPKSENATLIFLIYKLLTRKNFKYSTGESLHPLQWDKTAQRAKTNIKGDRIQLAKNKEVNTQLARYELKMVEVLGELKAAKETPTPEVLRAKMDEEFKTAAKASKGNFIDWIEDWVQTVKFTRTTPPRPINPRTIQKYKSTLVILNDFTNRQRDGRLSFNDINEAFYNDFLTHLREVCNHTENTAGKHLTAVKVFLREAFEAKATKNIFHENRKFTAPREDVSHVYLNENELQLIYDLDLSTRPALERVRDLFIVGANTTLRFSDFGNIHPENIQQTPTGKVLRIATQKTGAKVVIPLSRKVEEILSKYDGNLPKAISNQKFNAHLKTICQMAGINSLIEETKTVGGKRTSTTAPKFQLISSHTARRSAATNMYLAGVPTLSIMKLTGHKTESVFMRYISMDEDTNAAKMSEHGFFNGEKK